MARPPRPRRFSGRLTWPLFALAALFVAIQFAPEALAFPYHERIGDTDVYSEQPIPPQMAEVLARAEARLRTSPIYSDGYSHRIFLTQGGWRWTLLSLDALGSFAHTRLGGPIIVTTSDPGRDLVTNGRAVGGARPLSEVIAHERTHGLVRSHFGPLVDLFYPAWLREGYCDYVAGASSLTDAEAAALEARRESHPALLYYHGRQRVAAELARNGNDVDRLFADAR